jgi:hypothetical protein
LPRRVLDKQVVAMAGGRAGGCPYDLVIDQVSLHDLRAFARNCFDDVLRRSRGNVDACRQAEQRGDPGQLPSSAASSGISVSGLGRNPALSDGIPWRPLEAISLHPECQR